MTSIITQSTSAELNENSKQVTAQLLQTLCAEVLSIPPEQIHLESSFASLGGDSFRAVSLHAKCSAEGLDISLRDILLRKPLCQIATAACQHDASGGSQSLRTSLHPEGHTTFPRMPREYDFSAVVAEMRSRVDERETTLECVEDVYPCSAMQETMYVGQETRAAQLYRTIGLLKVRGHVSAEKVGKCWQQVVNRHQALRTVYVPAASDSERLLDAVVLKQAHASVCYERCRDKTEVQKRYASRCSSSYRFLNGILHQAIVYTTDDGAVFCLLDLSHMITDGPSWILLFEDFSSALRGTLAPEVAPGYDRYLDYIHLEYDADAALDYWVNYLQRIDPCNFPVLNDRTEVDAGVAEIIDMALPQLDQLRGFAKDNETTLSAILQTAWALVLRNYTGNSDVCFGYLSSGRSLPIRGVEGIVGPLINLLACKVTGISHQSARSVFRGIQQDFADALPHQYVSMAQVQRVLGTRELQCFNTAVTVQYAPTMMNGSSELVPLASHNATEFNIVVKILYSDDSLRVRLCYRPAVLSHYMARRVASTFSKVVSTLQHLDDLDQSLSEIDCLSRQDWDQIHDWNRQTLSHGARWHPTTIHSLIAQTTERQPEALAVDAWDGVLEYRRLEELATLLAGQIAHLGIGPGVLIPLCFEKSVWYTVALLAVLKSGNAFVPLDRSNPTYRLGQILSQLDVDADSGLVIASREHAEKFLPLCKHVITLEPSYLTKLPAVSAVCNLPRVSPRDRAYVMYTSGSTGVPKGAVIEHGAYAYAARAHGDGLHITKSSRILQFASYGFDTSIEDHLTTLVLGGCLCVPSEEERLSNLVGFANRAMVNWAHLTPSVASILDANEVPLLETMLLGGEAMTLRDAQAWAGKQNKRLIQVYGPSECCVTSTINEYVAHKMDPTNIGRTFEGCASWLVRLDTIHALAPIGAVGELLIEGPILAREYLEEPEKTASSFVRGLAWAPTKRFYRTGDLAYYDSEGDIHFLGRMDAQVKVHGQRIEPGEIEQKLALAGSVLHSLVLMPKLGPCAGMLVAAIAHQRLSMQQVFDEVVFERPASARISSLRNALLDLVPPYMIPTVWLVVRDMPRNTSGKLDRKRMLERLEEMKENEFGDLIGPVEVSGMELPVNDLELALRKVWSTVLNVSEVNIGRSSTFFSLGGDSISAMSVSSVARGRGIAISAAEVLGHQTIERLANDLDTHAEQTPFADYAKTQTGVFWSLSPIQQMHFQAAVEGDQLDQQTMVLSMTQPVPDSLLRDAFQSLVEVHPMLRARFTSTCHGWAQHVTDDVASSFALRFHHADYHQEDVIQHIADAKFSIDMRNGPLMAIDVFKMGVQRLLSITVHHLVMDAVSWRIMLEDVEGIITRGAPALPEPVHFQAWGRAQLEHARIHLDPSCVLPVGLDVQRADLSFWGMVGRPVLFQDSVSSEVRLDKLTSLALSKCAHYGYEEIDLLSTAVLLSFLETFGQPSASLFVEGHGREPFQPGLDLSRTLGWFTTLAPLTIDKNADALAALGLIKRLRTSTLGKGYAYFTSRFLNDKGVETFQQRHWPMEMMLNYLGRFQQLERHDALFQRCEPRLQSMLSQLRLQQRAKSQRYSLITVLAAIENGALTLTVEWNKHMNHQQKLDAWPARIKVQLERLVATMEAQATEQPREVLASPVTIEIKSEEVHKLVEAIPSSADVRLHNVEAVYPCSPIQESLLLSQLKKPDAYHQHFLFRLVPGCDDPTRGRQERLTRAWTRVVERHVILRTVFVETCSGGFAQVVLRKVKPAIFCVGSESQDAVIRAWERDRWTQGPLPLSGRLLHSLKIYVVDDGSLFCQLDKNHLLSDGVSSRIMIQDLLDAYGDRLEVLSASFMSYIRHISETDLTEAKRYWSLYLDGATRCQFPRLGPCKEEGDQGMPLERVELLVDSKRGLKRTCGNFGISDSSALQAAWALVLRAYTHSEAIAFGFLASGRDVPVPGIEKIVGPMVNLLPIRVRAASESSVLELARGIQQDYLGHLSRQTVSLGRIQHAVGSGDGLFNTIFNLQKAARGQKPAAGKAGDSRLELVKSHDGSEYGVSVSITDEPDRYVVSVEFATSLMSAQQAKHVVAAYGKAIEAMVQAPETAVSDVSLFSRVDEEQVKRWNAKEPGLVARCIQELVQETVQRQPSSTAIYSWEGEWTYAEVDRLSSAVACRLLSSGVQCEEVVALCFEKSAWAVVAMVGVAKAGGVFVHVDAQAPRARTQAIVAQTRCRWALAGPSCGRCLDGLVGEVLVLSGGAAEEWGRAVDPDRLARVPRTPSSALYMVFTSGSTGRPKGVVIEHQSFCSAVAANRAQLRIEATSRVLQFTSYSFDAALEEIFTVLVAGGCICVPGEQERVSDVAGFVRRAAVNWAAFTPSFLRSLAPSELPSLDFITVHAEPMSQALVAAWADRVHMRASYGPTECSVTSTVGARMTARSDAANIGWPVGCRAWVVDAARADTLVPVGAVGELVLEGPIVGRGYLRDPQQTAAAFISFLPVNCPLPSRDARRAYRTGDLVRYAADGSLLFLRRRDDSQVKLRGQRVELAEIQHHLHLAPELAHALVLLPTRGPLQARLTVVASLAHTLALARAEPPLHFLHLSPDWTAERAARAASALAAVTKRLSHHLPTYMLPHTWLLVGRLPLQLSCKLDRNRVASWVEALDADQLLAARQLRKQSRTPGSPLEESIRRVWADVLAMDDAHADLIQWDDAFFAVGGDSISAIHVARQCRAMGLAITTQHMLVEQTIRDLAAVAALGAPVATPVPRQEPRLNLQQELDPAVTLALDQRIADILPCSPFQECAYHALHTDPATPYLYHTLVELTSDPHLDAATTARAWCAVVHRHAILRTAFVPAKEGDSIYQLVLDHTHSQVDCIITAVDDESSVRASASMHMAHIRSNCLASIVPPLALRLFVLPCGRLFALLAIGHMIIDHVSLAHILSDWDRFCRGWHPLSEPPVPSSFADYARHLSSRNLGPSTTFWEKRLRSFPPCQVSVPTPDAVDDPYAMGTVSFSIESAGAVQSFCRSASVSLSNLLQFAWALVLRHHTGQDAVCFGHLVSDRDMDTVHVDDIVGPVLSLVVGQVTISDSLTESLHQLQDNNISAFNHKVFDMNELARRLAWPARRCFPTFNTLFNYRKVTSSGQPPVTRFRRIHSHDPHPQPIVLSFNEIGSQLNATLTYHKSVLSLKTARKTAAMFSSILDSLCAGTYCTTNELMRGFKPLD